jgi:uncharacterized protein
MTFDSTQWLLAAAAAFLIGLSKTGVPGIGMLFIAIFANLMPTKQASGFVLPLLIMGDLIAVFSYRRHTEWSHLRRLFLWTGLGVVIGALTLDHLTNRQAQLLVGTIILALLILHLARKKSAATDAAPPLPASASFAPTIGVLTGFTTLIANAAGPLMTIYFLAMRLPKLAFFGTGAVFFLLLNLFKIPFMVGLGLVTGESLQLNLYLAPAVITGALLGRWILPKVSQLWFERLALALSAVAGLKLLLG